MKKNILFILPWLPYPLKSGGHQAIYNGIKAISNDYNIIITYPTDEISHKQELCKKFISTINNYIIIEPLIIKETKRGFFQYIIHILHILLWNIKQFILIKIKTKNQTNSDVNISYKNWIEELLPKDEIYLRHINYLISKYNIDLIQCEMLGNCSIVTNIPKDIRKVFVHHEIGFIRNQQELITLTPNSQQGKAFLESKKILEIGLLNQYNSIITLSELDKNILEENDVKVPIHPSIAITENNYTYINESNSSHTLTFVGPEFHTPNAFGVKWFLNNSWEILKEKDSSYVLNIIGNWSDITKSTISKTYKDVHFLGYVDDLSEALRNTIMIVPITVGSGIRMKILEAASIGVPIVTTTIGVSGIKLENEYHCYISDIPQDFVNSIIKLKDKQTRLKMIERAYNLISKNYSIQALRENRLAIYNSLF